jgi:hypothetical protein
MGIHVEHMTLRIISSTSARERTERQNTTQAIPEGEEREIFNSWCGKLDGLCWRLHPAQAQIGGNGSSTGDVVEKVSSETWARHYWSWQDTGQISPDAVIYGVSAGEPSLNPIEDGLRLFDMLSGQTATSQAELWQAVGANSESFGAFRHYTMTGQLVTPIGSDLALAHLDLAMDNPDIFETTTSDGYLVSKVDKKKKRTKKITTAKRYRLTVMAMEFQMNGKNFGRI